MFFPFTLTLEHLITFHFSSAIVLHLKFDRAVSTMWGSLWLPQCDASQYQHKNVCCKLRLIKYRFSFFSEQRSTFHPQRIYKSINNFHTRAGLFPRHRCNFLKHNQTLARIALQNLSPPTAVNSIKTKAFSASENDFPTTSFGFLTNVLTHSWCWLLFVVFFLVVL